MTLSNITNGRNKYIQSGTCLRTVREVDNSIALSLVQTMNGTIINFIVYITFKGLKKVKRIAVGLSFFLATTALMTQRTAFCRA